MPEQNDEFRMPTADEPLNGPRRRSLGPAVLTLLLLALIAIAFMAIGSTGVK